MSTVADRIAWILAEKKWSARELARRSNLSETTVSAALKALQKDPEGIVLRTLKAIATGAGVSLVWLATGEGTPYAEPIKPQDPWPNRTAGAALARRSGVQEDAIESVLAEPVTSERVAHTPAWWLATMRLREVELNEKSLAEPAPQPSSSAAVGDSPRGKRRRRPTNK